MVCIAADRITARTARLSAGDAFPDSAIYRTARSVSLSNSAARGSQLSRRPPIVDGRDVASEMQMTQRLKRVMFLRNFLLASAGAMLAVGIASGGQTRSTGQTAASSTALDGCVAASPESRKTFTLEDAGQGGTYVLKGLDVHDFVGKHVQITGATSKRVRVVGGLYPSPNVAAQAGAIDPTRAAIASQSGPTAQAPKPVVEFNVKSVRIVSGACPER